MTGECEACGFNGVVDRAHIKSKGSGGTMDDFNIILLCREHHTEQHKLGWNKMSIKHSRISLSLASRGWKFREEFGRIKLFRGE